MSEMEESDSSQQKKCPCGFWGSTKTLGLCSKCYKEHTEKSKDSLDPKAELMKDRPRQPQFGGRDSLGPGPSSYAPPSLMTSNGRQPSSKPFEKAEELLRNAMKQSGVELTINTNNKNSNSNPNSDSSADKKTDSSADKMTEMSASTSKTDNNDTVKSEKVSSNSSESEGYVDGEKRGIKRDSSVLDAAEDTCTSTPESTPEKGGGGKSKKKCGVCKCKLELAQRAIGKCRCENVYCSLHRLPEQHNCTFDHKEDGRREAREKMIKPTRHLGTSFKRLDSDS